MKDYCVFGVRKQETPVRKKCRSTDPERNCEAKEEKFAEGSRESEEIGISGKRL